MNITEIKYEMSMDVKTLDTTNEELQNEYNYIMAENLTRKLLKKGLISEDEFNKIMKKNVAVFSPFFSRI